MRKSNDENQAALSNEKLLKIYNRMISKAIINITGRHKKINGILEFEDLFNSGVLGLLDAKRKYNPEIKASFSTYAYYRIAGAIYDEIRSTNHLSRSDSRKMKKIRLAIKELEQKEKRCIGNNELFEKVGFNDSDIRLFHTIFLPITSDEYDLFETIEDEAAYLFTKKAHNSLDIDYVFENLNQLPPINRLVICLYFFEEMPMSKIGKILNLTESRICQIKIKSLQFLKNRLGRE